MLLMKEMVDTEPSDQPRLRRLRNSIQVNVCLCYTVYSISKFLTYFVGGKLFLSYGGKLFKWVEINKNSNTTPFSLS